ncbi:hypothetical protein F5887DRAFT_1079204 [Amanita rubescens]|nr:hypothetical protein F5887DRAFT_1079204 [Amanita rubescens]
MVLSKMEEIGEQYAFIGVAHVQVEIIANDQGNCVTPSWVSSLTRNNLLVTARRMLSIPTPRTQSLMRSG